MALLFTFFYTNLQDSFSTTLCLLFIQNQLSLAVFTLSYLRMLAVAR